MEDNNTYYPYNHIPNEPQQNDADETAAGDSVSAETAQTAQTEPAGQSESRRNDESTPRRESAYDAYRQSNAPYDNVYRQNSGAYQQTPGYGAYPYASRPKVKKSHPFAKKLGRAAASAAVFGVVAGVLFQGVGFATKKITGTSNGVATVITTSAASDDVYDVSEVVKNVMPAMVSIDIKIIETVQNPFAFFGSSRSYQQESQGSGSGIIISQTDDALYIVTNNHVVEDATSITVTFVNDKSVDATVKGTDADADLAVVEIPIANIDADTLSAIKVAVMGNSDELQLGEPAIAIGNALGYGQSVTVGHISALDRKVQLTDNTMTLVQTDAAINPGNSGGALLNSKGEVIGINSVKYSSTEVEGIGYAIPISKAVPIINALVNGTAVPESEQAYLGITGSDVTEQYQLRFGLPEGIYVEEVTDGSPAAKGGIQPYDIITSFDGHTVKSMSELSDLIDQKKAGDTVSVTVKRSSNNAYSEVNLTVTLDSVSNKPETTEPEEDNRSSGGGNNGYYDFFDFFG